MAPRSRRTYPSYGNTYGGWSGKRPSYDKAGRPVRDVPKGTCPGFGSKDGCTSGCTDRD